MASITTASSLSLTSSATAQPRSARQGQIAL